MRKETFVAAVYGQRAALLRRLATLTDAQWDQVCPTPAPPPDVVRLDTPRRTVREVIAHLLVVDELVVRGGGIRSLRRLDHPGGWDLRRVGPLAQQSPAELVALLSRRGERFGRLVSTAPAAAYRVPVPVPGPFGRQSLCSLMGRRVLHEWLHEQDIAAVTPGPAATPRPASTAVGTVLADTVLQLLPSSALPRIDREQGIVRIVVQVDGADDAGSNERAIWGIDFSRRQYGPRVVRTPDATIRVDAAALALLAHGRGDRLGTTPCVDIDGDPGLAGAVLEALGSQTAPAPCAEMALQAAAS